MTAPAATSWRFPNVARAIAGHLIAAGLIADGRAGTDTPTDLTGSLPFVRILRIGGGSDHVNDYATATVEVFAATNAAAEQLAEAVRQYLTTYALPALGGVLLDRITCQTGPAPLAWADQRVRRYGATYSITARRYRS